MIAIWAPSVGKTYAAIAYYRENSTHFEIRTGICLFDSQERTAKLMRSTVVLCYQSNTSIVTILAEQQLGIFDRPRTERVEVAIGKYDTNHFH